MSHSAGHSYKFGRYRLSVDERLLFEDHVIKLSTTQFETLRLLVESGGRPLEKTEMVRVVCPTASDGPNTIERAVSDLRDKLRDPLDESRIIKAVRGGYRFAAEVRQVRDADEDPGDDVQTPADLKPASEPGPAQPQPRGEVAASGAVQPVAEPIAVGGTQEGVITVGVLWRSAGKLIQWGIVTGFLATAAMSFVGLVFEWDKINLWVSIPQWSHFRVDLRHRTT